MAKVYDKFLTKTAQNVCRLRPHLLIQRIKVSLPLLSQVSLVKLGMYIKIISNQQTRIFNIRGSLNQIRCVLTINSLWDPVKEKTTKAWYSSLDRNKYFKDFVYKRTEKSSETYKLML